MKKNEEREEEEKDDDDDDDDDDEWCTDTETSSYGAADAQQTGRYVHGLQCIVKPCVLDDYW